MKFLEWFDLNNICHLKAYKHLQTKGMWPKGFISDDMEMDINWSISIMSRMADALVNLKLKEEEKKEE
ncbi:MAG TPA: hypothetical protein VMZ91_00750, partial [Candidatus Paceibacterota bacterium]|nr:hypothetical protein [Candidatus Paceibacterota bacterium]